MHLMVVSRPDIAFAVGRIARAMQAPTQADFVAGKRILRYLAGSASLVIRYRRGGAVEPVASVDSSFADGEGRRSTHGFDIFLAGGPIMWRSMLQRLVTLSTAEAEYVGLSDCVKSVRWIRSLLHEFGFDLGPTLVDEDNKACIHIAENAVCSKRTKHIDLRFHHIREAIAAGYIKLRQARIKRVTFIPNLWGKYSS
jgi:hypothetical protein